MSFARRLIEDAVRDFAIQARDIEWIFANEEGDRPAQPFGTILVSSSVPLGTADVKLEDSGDQIIERLREIFEISVSIQAIGRDAMDAIEALKTHARRPSTIIGSTGGVLLGFMSASESRDLAAVVQAGWEGRAQADFRFSARFDCELTIDAVGSVVIQGAGSTHTFEVPQT